jgi:hypothetical protein
MSYVLLSCYLSWFGEKSCKAYLSLLAQFGTRFEEAELSIHDAAAWYLRNTAVGALGKAVHDGGLSKCCASYSYSVS